ncbi:MAG: hypothetical protein QXS66_04350 [Thermoproteota archaeon]|nr:hypothetical protein [Candidatus Brockarchaeota archaeon]
MKLEEDALRKTLEEALSSESGEITVAKFEKMIPKTGHIRYRGRFEKGLYLIRVVRREDGKIFEWSMRKEETGDELAVCVPREFLGELVEKEVEITVVKYDYSLHFKSKGPNFYFSPREGLIVEGREIELERIKPHSWSREHGASMVAKLKESSISGSEIYFMFFEDGDFSLFFKEEMEGGEHKATLSIEGNLLIIEYEERKSIVPIVVQEWKEGVKYYLNIPVEEKVTMKLVDRLRKIFGYFNVEALQKKIDEGELLLIAYFDNGRFTTCSIRELRIYVPSGAKVLEYVVIHSTLKFPYSGKLSEIHAEEIKEASPDRVGDYGEDVAKVYMENDRVAEIGKAKFIAEEVKIKVTKERVDLVFKAEDDRFVIVEVKASKTSEEELAGDVHRGLEQLKGYREHIREYGLDLTEEGLGIEKGGNIKAYVIVYVFFDLENKEVRTGHIILPGD